MSGTSTEWTSGGVRFAIEFSLTTEQLAAMTPDQMREFFTGLAMLVRARATAEMLDKVQYEQRALARDIEALAKARHANPEPHP